MAANCLDDLLHEMAWTDADLLREVSEVARTSPESVPRNPAWSAGYDPLAILASPESYPEHELTALVNVRIALHPDESWGKCANCGNIYRHGSGTVCSAECWDEYARYIAAGTGTPLSRFGLEEEARDIAFHGSRDDSYGGRRIEGNPYGRDLY